MDKGKKRIYDIISYTFNNESIIQEALTPPFPQKQPSGDDKIEFKRLKWLGNSILDMVATDLLYKDFPEEDEGFLAKKKRHMVSANTVLKVAKLIEVEEFIFRDPYGFFINTEKSFSDTVEAIIGAIYVDSGIENVTNFIKQYWTAFVTKGNTETEQEQYSPKSSLKVWSDKNKKGPVKYEVVETSGPGYEPTYKVKVSLDNVGEAFGVGKTKKEAENEAAKTLCMTFDYLFKDL